LRLKWWQERKQRGKFLLRPLDRLLVVLLNLLLKGLKAL
jgi:hypothetical protein